MLPLEHLVEIHALRYSEEYRPEPLERALELICTKTLNTGWYAAVCGQLRGLSKPPPESPWVDEALDNYNAEARRNRELYHKASESFDANQIAEASIKEGLWHVNGGEFRMAQAAFNAAKTADKSKSFECMYYNVQIDLLQREYSLVASTIGKQFPTLIKSSREKYVPEILLSYALALWQTAAFPDAAVVLLHAIGELKHLPLIKKSWPWLTHENIATICVVCCLMSLDRQNIEYLAYTDLHMSPLYEQWPYLKQLIVAYLDVRIGEFTQYWDTLASNNSGFLLTESMNDIRNKLKDRLLRNFLAVRSQCSLQEVLGAFGARNVLELSAEARRKNYPLEIDPVDSTVKIVTPSSTKTPQSAYIQDSMLTIWHSIETTLGPGFETPTPMREARARNLKRAGGGSKPPRPARR